MSRRFEFSISSAWPVLLSVFAALIAFTGHALADVKVYPSEITLSGARDFQQIVVQHIDNDGVTVDATNQSSISIEDSNIARIVDRTILPLANGKTKATIQLVDSSGSDTTIQIPILVNLASADPPLSFQREVVPILTKTGCNSGRCHGAARGKDGFMLSLFGYDAVGDHHRLTKQISGRRINFAVPEDSLLLRKSVGTVTHTGGKRFSPDSDYYTSIKRWIEEGATFDEIENAEPVSLHLYPPRATLVGEGSRQSFIVVANYADGTSRDVTALSVFLSNNDSSVSIADDGTATSGLRGEAFVMARFATITERSQVIVLPKDAVSIQIPDHAEFNDLDRFVNEKLKTLRIVPSDLCSDEEFLRRVYIDLIGLTPTVDEYDRFLDQMSNAATSEQRKEKRSELIDELLEREEFVDLWTMKWGEMLRIRTANQVSYKALLGFHEWLRSRIANNTKWNEIARDVLSATGGTFETPPTNYYQIESNAQLIAENVAQVFMGMRIQCAKCHNHPFDRWTMDDYYGFADFFGQIGFKQSRDPREFIVYDRGQGEVEHFVDSRHVEPKFLGGATPKIDAKDRRTVLAEWIASDENPYFARHMANIVWAHHFGRGIVEPVDDVRISNPPANPELLDELGKRFMNYNYDLKRLVRDICNSHTYQRSTRSNATNKGDVANYAKAQVRRIRAEVLLDSISQITGTVDRFPRLPIGARSVQVADGAVSNYFLSTFGRAPRETVCSCEVDAEPNLSQAFHLLNGETTNKKITQGGVIEVLLKKGYSPEQIIVHIYNACLCRQPTQSEKERLLATIGADPVADGLHDIFWAVLNSKEFVFNH